METARRIASDSANYLGVRAGVYFPTPNAAQIPRRYSRAKRLEGDVRDDALAKEGRTRENFQLVITPPYGVSADMVKGYEDLGVDRLIVHLGSQKPERVAA